MRRTTSSGGGCRFFFGFVLIVVVVLTQWRQCAYTRRVIGSALLSILRGDGANNALSAEDIAGSIRRLIVSGKFEPGETLPTIRALASDLRVSTATIGRAYRLLADEGFVRQPRFSRDRYVIARNDAAVERARTNVLRGMIRRFIAEARRNGFSLDEVYAAWMEQCVKNS